MGDACVASQKEIWEDWSREYKTASETKGRWHYQLMESPSPKIWFKGLLLGPAQIKLLSRIRSGHTLTKDRRALWRLEDDNLCELCLRTTKAKTVKKLFYQKLLISINELENKKQKKELILYPNKNGTVASLLAEAAKVIEFHETKLLRISELSKNRLAPGPAKDTPLEILVRQELERLE
ncbi:hypothetical protein quinque_013136 [Culex quinquefasciatus]